MTDRVGLEAMLSDWRARWPEWEVAEVFLAPDQRETASAWFALLEELAQAAWGGTDPTPGLAKLGWWQEELKGWSRGMRRHPLALALQKLPADWSAFADSLGVLRKREVLELSDTEAADALRPLLEAVARVESVLFGEGALPGEALQLLHTLRVASGLPVPAGTSRRTGPRPRRLMDALAMARTRARRSGDRIHPSRWRTLLLAWRSARGD